MKHGLCTDIFAVHLVRLGIMLVAQMDVQNLGVLYPRKGGYYP